MSEWAYPWKMMFNLDTSKPDQEIVFSPENSFTSHGTIYFNNMPIVKKNVQKHLRLLSDVKIICLEHITEKLGKRVKVLTS